MPRLCKLCRQRPGVVPDRDAVGPDRWAGCICRECHGERLLRDLRRATRAMGLRADAYLHCGQCGRHHPPPPCDPPPPDDAPTPDDAPMLASWSGHDWYADLGGEGGHE